ncbi:hypothetical protein HXX76_014135 [Chlamydomonas incerta]|uniref:Uncharacterized protein n=1 Tax=Chlamydomonas incerta TaxID=51695 RepID=A0A835VQ14_CHLIN|nr:hypothetical protein HXX76_014135 [Chlamydomonas incerta]|eukprot:KAG2424977.1 hypothetical protein HXX76_014135 [Chlamydomonas incerta]
MALFQSDRNRYVMFPVVYKDVYDLYKKAVSSIWTAEEVDLTRDKLDWEKLSDNERFFLEQILAFFSASDGIVNDNLAARFMHEVAMPEAKAFYSVQIMIETIHSETYGLLLDTLVTDSAKKAHLFNAMAEIPTIQRKAEWAIRWIEDRDASFEQRLLAFACVEGIMFSGSFAAIFWMREQCKMPGLSFSNDLISRDEGLHTEFAVLLYNKYVSGRLEQDKAHQLVREAVDMEKDFICNAIPCSMIGMSAPQMQQYIEYVADRLLLQLGYQTMYGSANPFSFMERISLEGRVNLHDRRNGDYSLANVSRTLLPVVDF